MSDNRSTCDDGPSVGTVIVRGKYTTKIREKNTERVKKSKTFPLFLSVRLGSYVSVQA